MKMNKLIHGAFLVLGLNSVKTLGFEPESLISLNFYPKLYRKSIYDLISDKKSQEINQNIKSDLETYFMGSIWEFDPSGLKNMSNFILRRFFNSDTQVLTEHFLVFKNYSSFKLFKNNSITIDFSDQRSNFDPKNLHTTKSGDQHELVFYEKINNHELFSERRKVNKNNKIIGSEVMRGNELIQTEFSKVYNDVVNLSLNDPY